MAPFQQDSMDMEHKKFGQTSQDNDFDEGLAGPFSSNIFNKLVITTPPSTKIRYKGKRTAPQMGSSLGPRPLFKQGNSTNKLRLFMSKMPHISC